MRGIQKLVMAAALGLAPFLATAAHAAPDIDVAGSWLLTIGAGDLIAGAGSDLISTYESSPSQVYVSITNAVGAWRVDVRLQTSNWDSSLHLWVRRTGNGVGGGFIAGGTSYQEVTSSTRLFFVGWLDRTNIPLQFRLTGVSVLLAPDTYSATVTYTVTAL